MQALPWPNVIISPAQISIPFQTGDGPPSIGNALLWVTRRKAVIVNAVRTGVISLEEVWRRYELSVAEFLAWQHAIDAHGVPGLRVTRLQIYRDNPPSGSKALLLAGKAVHP